MEMKEIDPNYPIDKQAAIIVSKCHDRVRYFNPGDKATSMVCFPIRKFKGKKQFDLTGKNKGRLEVIGICAIFKRHPKKGCRWVVRCQCGRYEIRLSSSLNRVKNANDMCHECDKRPGIKSQYKVNPSKSL